MKARGGALRLAGRVARLKKLLAALLFALALLPLSAQAEMEFHGALETLQAAPFSKNLGLTDSRSSFTGEVTVHAGAASAFVSLSAEYNGVSPERTGLSLGEAWMDWGAGGFQLRLGRQLVSWGAADGIVLTDVVCPQNLTAYAGLDFAGSRLPVDGVRLRYSFPVFAAEVLWIPLFTPARLPGDEQNPLYGVFYPASVDMGGAPLPVRVLEAAPPRTIAGGEYGIRLSAYTPALDFSLALFYGWNDIPHFRKDLSFSGAVPERLNLTPGYARTLMAGADASVPLGDFLLRLEAAFTGGGRYDRRAGETAAALLAGQIDEPVEKHSLKLLAGLDWNPSGWTLSAQYYEDLLPDAYGGGAARPWRKNALTLRVGRSFFRELLNLSAWCYLDLRDFDASAGASAAWALSDSLSLSLGSDFFTGGIENRGDYGAYADLSALWIKGIFRF
ncbi:MAG: hypothetical protein LBE02_04045 [Spirochaetaceae bacterium]|nr:hypothetical protein [Spirochaetaceae bacterium]